MMKPNDKIVYGSLGVCVVNKIVDGEEIGCSKGEKYYVLKPLFDQFDIYVPVNSKVSFRELVSKEEIDSMLASISEKEPEIFYAKSVQQLREYYDAVIKTQSCEELINLLFSIYAKKNTAEKNKRKFGQMDERYMRKIEQLLFTEFSVVLGVEYRDVKLYLNNIISNG